MKIAASILLILVLPLAALAVEVKAVIIDPGHGGFDTGFRPGVHDAQKPAQAAPKPGQHALKEKEAVSLWAKELEGILKAAGKSAVITRRADRYLSIAERVLTISKSKAEVLISLHAGAGFAVYVAKLPESGVSAKRQYSLNYRQKAFMEQSKQLASHTASALKQDFGAQVASREAPLPVLASAPGAAVLVEAPLTSDPKRLAEALFKAISLYEAGK